MNTKMVMNAHRLPVDSCRFWREAPGKSRAAGGRCGSARLSPETAWCNLSTVHVFVSGVRPGPFSLSRATSWARCGRLAAAGLVACKHICCQILRGTAATQLTLSGSSAQFVDSFRASGRRLDCLVCNAAVYLPTSKEPEFTADGAQADGAGVSRWSRCDVQPPISHSRAHRRRCAAPCRRHLLACAGCRQHHDGVVWLVPRGDSDGLGLCGRGPASNPPAETLSDGSGSQCVRVPLVLTYVAPS